MDLLDVQVILLDIGKIPSPPKASSSASHSGRMTCSRILLSHVVGADIFDLQKEQSAQSPSSKMYWYVFFTIPEVASLSCHGTYH